MYSIDRETIHLFSNAFILGGSPYSAKSTIAEKLSAQFDFQYYKVDDHEQDHIGRSTPERHPVMHRYSNMSWQEIWSQPAKPSYPKQLRPARQPGFPTPVQQCTRRYGQL